MIDLRNISSVWSIKTYGEGLSLLNICDTDLLNQAIYIFKELNIYDIKMDGYSCEKLPKTEEARTGVKITYSEVFHDEINKPNFSPASYLLHLIQECNKSSIPTPKIVGTLARGLRTLTSLLREPDFSYQLETILKCSDSNVTTSLNAKQDSSDHTDVLLFYKNKTYRIWLYQFSSRGLPHDIERLTGKRGELPNGTHLICPLHTELAIEYDRQRKRYVQLQEKLQIHNEKLLACSIKALKKRESIELRIRKITSEINLLSITIDEEYKHSIEELDIVNGWFFYSEKHIRRIVNYINEPKNPMTYSAVTKILTAPESFVGQINMFCKGE